MRLAAPRASASCGITSARTKLVASSRRRPGAHERVDQPHLVAVGMTSGSFWKPSRGPTSRMRTSWGASPESEHRAGFPLGRSVAVIGGSGALGFGLAVRSGSPGARSSSARATPPVPRRPPPGCASAARTETSRPRSTRGGGARRRRLPHRAFRNQSETLTNLKEAPERGPARGRLRPCRWRPRSGKATRIARRLAGLRRPAGAGDGPRRASPSSPPCTRSALQPRATPPRSWTRTSWSAATARPTRRGWRG